MSTKELEIQEVQDGSAIRSPRGELIQMEGPRKRLEDIALYTPIGRDRTVQSFCKLLASRLNNPQLYPMGINMCVTLLFHDLQTGVDGFTGKPFNSSIADQPAILYAMLRTMHMPKIIEAVFEPKDAQAITRVMKEIEEEVARS